MPLSHVPISFIASKSVASAALTCRDHTRWGGRVSTAGGVAETVCGSAVGGAVGGAAGGAAGGGRWGGHQSLVGWRQGAARADGVAAAVCARRHRGPCHGAAHRDVGDQGVGEADHVEARHVLGQPEGQLAAHLGRVWWQATALGAGYSHGCRPGCRSGCRPGCRAAHVVVGCLSCTLQRERQARQHLPIHTHMRVYVSGCGRAHLCTCLGRAGALPSTSLWAPSRAPACSEEGEAAPCSGHTGGGWQPWGWQL